VIPQQPSEPNLKQVAGAQDTQGRFLFRRLERPFLFEFVLQFRAHYGKSRLFRSPANSLHVIYRPVKTTA
jgi:hypothetical protein